MASPRPYTQTKLAENLEQYYLRRANLTEQSELADWERDTVFMRIALSLWPVDAEAAGSAYQQSARMRLRLRWEGFQAIISTREQLESLVEVADHVKAHLRKKHR